VSARLDDFDAAIFDMDGLLIDTEGIWRRAERECFGRVGIDITEQMSDITSSMTTGQVAAHWYAYRPWKGRSTHELEEEVVSRVRELIGTLGQSMPGVIEMLEACRAREWALALATNSPLTLCEHVIDTLKLRKYFSAIISADQVKRGKPAPDIYVEALRRLDVSANKCVAFEDSAAGVCSALDAGLTVIAIPQGETRWPHSREPHAIYPSLLDFWRAHFHC
jgi:sugar-phosphatase